MASQDEDKPKSKRIFINQVDQYQGKNIAKVSINSFESFGEATVDSFHFRAVHKTVKVLIVVSLNGRLM